jgi:HEAT repeat protein
VFLLIGNALDEAAFSDEETKQRIIRDLATHPDETLESIRTVLTTPQKGLWREVVQVIRAIGYPRNVLAIPELVDQVSDLISPVRTESIQALTEMARSVVVPHLLKALLDSHQTRE